MDWIWRRCLFLADEVDPPLAKPPKIVLIVSHRGGWAEVTSVRAGWGSRFAGWLGCLSWRESREASMVRTRLVIGSGRVVFSADKTAEMVSTNQFFNFILECFTFLCGVVVISMIAAVFSHVNVGRSGRHVWWWDEVGL